MARYRQIMNRFSPLVELLLEASLDVGRIVGRAQAVRYRQLLDAGHQTPAARAQVNALFQYSGGAGGPLARLARITINAIKVEQVVEEALNEIRDGRKPLITFHSTGAALLNETATHAAVNANGCEVSLSLSNQISAGGGKRVPIENRRRSSGRAQFE